MDHKYTQSQVIQYELGTYKERALRIIDLLYLR